MGAWNSKPFGNDTAKDWVWSLEKATDETLLNSTLDAVLTANDQPETSACEKAIAAATVIYAASHEPVLKLPKEAADWVKKQGYSPSIAVIQKAVTALEVILKDSELRDLWEESSSTKWPSETQKLLSNLQEALKREIPTRQPKKLGLPRDLEKLIEGTDPEDKERRAKIIERLSKVENSCLIDIYLGTTAKKGFIPEAQFLIERGADVNTRDAWDRPLLAAIKANQIEMVQFLLVNGAQVIQDNNPNTNPLKQSKALLIAVHIGSIPIIELLREYGADLHQKMDVTDYTLLHEAAEQCRLEVVEYLIKNGLNVNDTAGKEDVTPLTRLIFCSDYRSEEKIIPTIKKLLTHGADPNYIGSSTMKGTALDNLCDKHIHTAALLRKHGAKFSSEL